ncbi:MAG TPA: hypothetical protein DD637_05565 [Verrucomicrobia bacterium]|nr:hypothetical protein [Verrucomicrobiota bacterium]
MKTYALFGLAVWAMVAAAETRVYRTEARGGEMREVAGNFWSDLPQGNANTVDLDAAAADHPFTGLGVSIPESSCWLLSRLPAEKRAEILRAVWTADGAGLSVARLQIGSSDYSMHAYTYDDVAGDTELEHFSIDPDRRYVLPVVKEIQKINPDVTFFASPWSPPAWMKDNGNVAGGSLLREHYGVYARYFVKYIQAFQKEGVTIQAVTTQNEPECDQFGMSPTCLWTGEQEMAFIVNHLAPALKAAGLQTKPWLWDHNFDGTNRVWQALARKGVLESIGAVAWHPYVGQPEWIKPIHAKYPDLPMVMTEMGPHVDRYRRDMLWWGDLMMRTFNSGCGGFTSWCMVLDEHGQPNITGGFPCAGFVEIDSVTGEAVPSEQFKAFRHVGRFVRRGADILKDFWKAGGSDWARRNDKRTTCAAFRNPDGSHVVVVACKPAEGDAFSPVQVQVKYKDRYLIVQALPGSLTTIVVR